MPADDEAYGLAVFAIISGVAVGFYLQDVILGILATWTFLFGFSVMRHSRKAAWLIALAATIIRIMREESKATETGDGPAIASDSLLTRVYWRLFEVQMPLISRG